MGKARPSGHRVQRPRKSDHKSKLHQESERARPSERLRQEGKKRSAQGQTRAERSAVKAEKAKLRMGAAQEKLAAQAPAKPPGPVKRVAGAEDADESNVRKSIQKGLAGLKKYLDYFC